MTDKNAMQAAIAAAPNDETIKLIYADFLDETGGAADRDEAASIRLAAKMHLVIGQNYFVQTCTKDWLGRLVDIVGPYCVVLDDASWVADSGRLHQFMRGLREPSLENEPVWGKVIVQWVNILPYPFSLIKDVV